MNPMYREIHSLPRTRQEVPKTLPPDPDIRQPSAIASCFTTLGSCSMTDESS